MERVLKDCSSSQINHYIEEWIVGRNAERNREIMRRRLIDGVPYAVLAEEFDISIRRSKFIVYRGLEIIARNRES